MCTGRTCHIDPILRKMEDGNSCKSLMSSGLSLQVVGRILRPSLRCCIVHYLVRGEFKAAAVDSHGNMPYYYAMPCLFRSICQNELILAITITTISPNVGNYQLLHYRTPYYATDICMQQHMQEPEKSGGRRLVEDSPRATSDNPSGKKKRGGEY